MSTASEHNTTVAFPPPRFRSLSLPCDDIFANEKLSGASRKMKCRCTFQFTRHFSAPEMQRCGDNEFRFVVRIGVDYQFAWIAIRLLSSVAESIFSLLLCLSHSSVLKTITPISHAPTRCWLSQFHNQHLSKLHKEVFERKLSAD